MSALRHTDRVVIAIEVARILRTRLRDLGKQRILAEQEYEALRALDRAIQNTYKSPCPCGDSFNGECLSCVPEGC